MKTSKTPLPQDERHFWEMRLFLEELCCNLLRFHHAEGNPITQEAVRIDQEVRLNAPGAYADIRVRPPGRPTYFIEVKYGYDLPRVAESLTRKYAQSHQISEGANKLVVVMDTHRHEAWPEFWAGIRGQLHPGLELEVWDEARLLSLVNQCFGLSLDSISQRNLMELRTTIDQAKGRYAFGDDFANDPLQSSLLYHFGFWRVRQLLEGHRLNARQILEPLLYEEVVVLFADLCSFSSYVRDTRDPEVVRQCLSAFYSKARYQIINQGGMLYQFLGDGVIAVFGVPDRRPAEVTNALECAMALVDIGYSVSHEWQRNIDRVQESCGVHIGLTLGDLQFLSIRPFSRSRMSAIGDSVNMAARLNASAGSGEIVVSNSFHRLIDPARRGEFDSIESVDARNLGRIQAWKRPASRPPPG